jgi:hypothetical protein
LVEWDWLVGSQCNLTRTIYASASASLGLGIFHSDFCVSKPRYSKTSGGFARGSVGKQRLDV